MGCADFKVGRRRARGEMEALAVDENGAASQRIPRAESRPVGIGTHIFPVSEQFQTAGEIGIARIGDVDLSRGIRRPNGDGARAVKLGVQVDGSAGEGQRGAFGWKRHIPSRPYRRRSPHKPAYRR